MLLPYIDDGHPYLHHGTARHDTTRPKLGRIGDGSSEEEEEEEGNEGKKMGQENSSVSLSSKEEKEALLRGVYQEELALSVDCIKRNPKSYPAWHHHKWALEKGLGLLGER